MLAGVGIDQSMLTWAKHVRIYNRVKIRGGDWQVVDFILIDQKAVYRAISYIFSTWSLAYDK